MRPPSLTATKQKQNYSPELKAASKLKPKDPRKQIEGYDQQAQVYATDGPTAKGREPGADPSAPKVDNAYFFTSIDELCAGLGAVIDLAAPAPGVSTSFSTTVMVKFNGIGYLSFQLSTSASASAAGKSLAGSITLSGGIRADTYAGSAYLGLKGTVGMVAKGDSGAECMHLFMLAVDQHIRGNGVEADPALIERLVNARSKAERREIAAGHEEEIRAYLANQISLGIMPKIGDWVADQIFGAGYANSVLLGMDDESKGAEADSVKTYSNIGVEAGAELDYQGKRGVSGELTLGASESTLSKRGGKLKKKREATGVSLKGSASVANKDGRGVKVDASGSGLGVTVTLPAGKGGEAWKTTLAESLVAQGRSSLKALLGEGAEPALERLKAEVNRCGVTALGHRFGAKSSVVVKLVFGGDKTTLTVSSSTAWSKSAGDPVKGTPYFAVKGSQTREIASFELPGVKALIGG